MLSKDLLTAGVLTTLLLAVLFALPRENGLFRGSSRPTTMDGCCCCVVVVIAWFLRVKRSSNSRIFSKKKRVRRSFACVAGCR